MRKDVKIKHSLCSLHQNMGGFFLQKALNWETNSFEKIYGGLFYMGTNDQIMQVGGKVLQMGCSIIRNAFYSKSENFLQSWWETHLKINPNQSIDLWKGLSLKLMVKRFQR